MNQLDHQNTIFPEKKFRLILLLDHVTGPANIGSLFRLADAFNIEKMILCGPKTDLESNRLKRTARSTLEKVPFEQREDAYQTCRHFIENGYTVFALEITKDSVPLNSKSFRQEDKIVLVIGNENAGIDDKILKLAYQKIHIEMFGRNSSMNVAQATGIALYEITKSLPAI